MKSPSIQKYCWLLILANAIAIPSWSQAIRENTAEQRQTVVVARPGAATDSALLDIVQKQTFNYFWSFAHPVSGMARERSNENNEVVTTGGTGFGILAIIVATERKWITEDTAVSFLLKMLRFLEKAESFHGVFPHWMNGTTGAVIPFSRKDDGGDLVETAYLIEGLLCARQYFNHDSRREEELRWRINNL